MSTTTFDRYEALKRRGASAVDAYRAAKDAGMGDIDAVRMLREVFGLSLGEAKEAMIVASGTARSLSEHEAALAEELAKDESDE